MKSFIATIILFAIFLSGIILNSIYMKKGSEALIKSANELKDCSWDNFSNRLEELDSQWKRFRNLAEFSSSNTELEKIDLTIKEMKVYANKKIAADYAAANERLIFLLSELTRLEKLSFAGLI